MLMGIRDPAQAGAVARTVDRQLFARGVQAVPVQSLLDQAYRGSRALILVIDVLMRMGLVAGILGLGIVAMRAVAERRHVIGILRAIGYKRRSIILGLLAESAGRVWAVLPALLPRFQRCVGVGSVAWVPA